MNRRSLITVGLATALLAPGLTTANPELMRLMEDPNNWAIWGGNYGGQRYSELDEINAENVGDLQVAWTFSTGVLRGHEGGPLVIGDTLYIHTPFPNKVFAINQEDQSIIWRYEPVQDADETIPVMCCDTVSRGLAYADGKIFLQQADTHLVALDAENGEEIWKVKNGDAKKGINVIVLGQAAAVRLLNIAIFSRGHVLLEGDVGVGKTTLLRGVARLIGGGYERIEGTVDLMPGDLIYHTYVDEDGKPRVAPGPLLKHGEALSTFFFNEVNRARPQMHSLLLRVMAERSVTAFGREYRFPHLQVFADRNRVEKEETFEIPAAARDRFLMEIEIEAPSDPELQRALMVETRFHNVDRLLEQLPQGTLAYEQLNDVAERVQDHVRTTTVLETYALDLCRATAMPAAFGVTMHDVDVLQLVQSGVSPRGMSMLLRASRVAAWLDGRDYIAPEDIHQVFKATVGHRVFLRPVYELRRAALIGEFLDQVLDRVAAP